MAHRLRYVLRLLVVVVVTVVAWDALLFRSGLYYRWIEPQSTAGTTRSAIRLVDDTYAPGRRNILVFGNSKVSEGFSQLLADTAVDDHDLHFLNAAIPGTDLRAWYYLLRQLDPHAERFAAVVLSVSYDPAVSTTALADYPLDIAYLTPLLGLRDLFDFPASFDDAALAERARRAIVFPAQPLRDDIAAFLASPDDRRQHVRKWRRYFLPSALRYSGHVEALPDLTLDPHTLQPTDWGSDEASLRPRLAGYFNSLRESATAPVLSSNERYYRQWLTRIAAPYRAHGIPVILFMVPRGPWHAAIRPPSPAGAVADLVAQGLLTCLPADSFVDLERPHYFFDGLHMNHTGRVRFSGDLARRIAAVLH